MEKTIIELEAERLEWSLETFPEATAFSSLQKLLDEIEEVEIDLAFTPVNEYDLTLEYADCLMCLFDSAGRVGILPQQIFDAFAFKLEKNKSRTWIKNSNNTYSHVKNENNKSSL